MSGHVMSQQQPLPRGAALCLHHALTCCFLLDALVSIKICSGIIPSWESLTWILSVPAPCCSPARQPRVAASSVFKTEVGTDLEEKEAEHSSALILASFS